MTKFFLFMMLYMKDAVLNVMEKFIGKRILMQTELLILDVVATRDFVYIHLQ